MKDQDKIRERVELLLDNRQIFLIFLASAVILALVFSLGVVVGKRIGPPTISAPPTDPLALLDKMSKGEPVDENLTFHTALTKEAEEVQLGANAVDGSSGDVKAKPAGEKVEEKKEAKAAPVPAKKASSQQPPAKKKASEDSTEPGAKGKKESFSLQLSAFQERHEAEQFMLKLKQSGLKPYMVTTSIPGRGIWFRVRVGDYSNWEDALVAKENFEQRHKIIAYVTRK